jgi:hypothetical protein
MKVWTFAAAHGNYYNIHLCNFIREKGCDDFFALAFIFILPVTWSCGHIPLSILSSIRSTDVFCLAAAAQDPVYIVPLLSHSFSNTYGTPLPSLCTCRSPGSLVLIVLSFTAITVISTFESRSSGSSLTVLSSSAPPPLPSQGGHMLFRAALVPAWQRAFCHAQEPRP